MNDMTTPKHRRMFLKAHRTEYTSTQNTHKGFVYIAFRENTIQELRSLIHGISNISLWNRDTHQVSVKTQKS